MSRPHKLLLGGGAVLLLLLLLAMRPTASLFSVSTPAPVGGDTLPTPVADAAIDALPLISSGEHLIETHDLETVLWFAAKAGQTITVNGTAPPYDLIYGDIGRLQHGYCIPELEADFYPAETNADSQATLLVDEAGVYCVTMQHVPHQTPDFAYTLWLTIED